MLHWLTLVIISTVSFSLTSVLQRALLKEEQSDPIAYAFVFQMLVAALIFVYTLFAGFNLPPLLPYAPYLILMSLLYALGNLILFKSFQTTEASEVAVITSSKTIWTVATAAVFLGESISVLRITGTVLIILGVMIVSWKKGKWRFNKGHVLAGLSAVFFGVAFTNDAYLVGHFNDVPSYMTIAFLFPSLTILAFQPKAIKKLGLFFDKRRLLKLLAASFFYGVAAVTIFLAYLAGGDASQIAPISQSSIVLTIIIAYFVLKERTNLKNKIIGSLLVFAGVLLLKT